MLIKAPLSLPSSSRPSGLSPSRGLIWFPPRSDPFGHHPQAESVAAALHPPLPCPHPVPQGHSLARQCVPDARPLPRMTRTCLHVSPRHTRPRDHSLPQLPNRTYLLPPSLPLPRFCLVTERHLGTLPRLELASRTVPRNLRQSGRAARLPGYAWQTTH